MIKTIMLASVLMAFTFIAIPTAQAHCGICKTEKAQTTKPCEKCLKAGKTCKCAGKKPCEKTLGKKKPCTKCAQSKKNFKGKKKPCVKCLEAEKKFQAGKSVSSIDHSNKGSLTIRSKYGKTSGTSSYND